jgi:hypothetical protein
VFGKSSLPSFAKMQTLKKFFSIARLSGHTNTQPVRPKNGQQSLGRSRGGLSTKIHAAVDGLGNLARFRLTGGERHDITEAANLIL